MSDKKIILVTGSNKGIGFEVARQLAKAGNEVIVSARNAERGAEALNKLKQQGLTAHFIEMDVTNDESIRLACTRLESKFNKLDVLINNAAILLGADRTVSQDDSVIFNQTMLTNVQGPLLVTKYFLELMPAGSRIIMTSSGGGSMTDPVGGWSPAYCVSKSALNALTRHLAYELASRKISVNAYCPGWVRTDMGGKSAPLGVEQGADTAVWLATAHRIETGKFYRDRKVIPW